MTASADFLYFWRTLELETSFDPKKLTLDRRTCSKALDYSLNPRANNLIQFEDKIFRIFKLQSIMPCILTSMIVRQADIA